MQACKIEWNFRESLFLRTWVEELFINIYRKLQKLFKIFNLPTGRFFKYLITLKMGNNQRWPWNTNKYPSNTLSP